jgi:hypothetical protein
MEKNDKTLLLQSILTARKSIILEADKKGQRHKYASLEIVMDALMEPMFNNNLLLSHQEEYLNDDTTILVTSITHVPTEQSIETRHPMVSKSFLVKNTDLSSRSLDQEYGAQLTYSKRYSIQNLLGIVSEKDKEPDSKDYKAPNYTPEAKKDYSTVERISPAKAASLEQGLLGYPKLKAKLLKDCSSRDGKFDCLFASRFDSVVREIKIQQALGKDID